jgi:hypothetical protein
MSNTNLPINSLEYDEIRDNLISFLQNQKDQDNNPVYQDYDFQASGISTLLNLLSYNTHYIGYYVKMMLNESFVDSAVKRESLFSKAKLTGYVPRGKTSSRIDTILTIDIDLDPDPSVEPSSQRILIPKGTSFTSTNSAFDQRSFYVVEDTYITNRTLDGTVATYTSDPITVYEGAFRTWSFKVDYTLLNQRYILAQENIDIDTLRVSVTPDGSETSEEYLLADNLFEVTATDKVYYISTNELGLFEIIFGNGIFGYAPTNGSKVTSSFMISNGDSGNGCRTLTFQAPTTIVPTEFSVGNWEDFSVAVYPEDAVSNGGLDGETVDQLRFNIPHHNRRQQRLVTAEDYRSHLLDRYRNIDSVNVWGGEDHNIKDYGKIYISIKPKYADKLTATAKRDIEAMLLQNVGVVGMQPVFIDPEFINVEVEVVGRVNLSSTQKSIGEIERDIAETVANYNTNTLNVFSNFLSDVKMLELVIDQNPSLTTAFSRKVITKDLQFIYASGVENSIYFGNPLLPGVRSSAFLYGTVECYYADDTDGYLYIYKSSTGTKFVATQQGRVDYESGTIYFTFPTFATMVDNDFGTAGQINFRANPVDPDINTLLQNIVRITKIDVSLSDQ